MYQAESEVVAKLSECDKKKAEIQDAELLLPYYKFWTYAFGDDGIRKFVIDGIVPALNSQVAYWLDILIDGNIRLEFDNLLEETITRVPHGEDPFVYYAMSGGERRRLNLAVLQAFAHIMMLNSGASPNIVFLDEVAINIDTNGIEGVHHMIRELAQDKYVFVTTHDPTLLDLLDGCQVLELERRDGFTRIVTA